MMAVIYPTVAIIVPVYNGGRMLAGLLDSLVRLNYPADHYEIVVVDNCSTDNTADILARYPVKRLYCEERGPAAARNFGIAHSQSEIVAFTDADCVADVDWLAQLVQPYQDEKIGATGGDIHAFPQPEWDILDRFSAQFPPLVNFWSGENEFLPHLFTANASYRREALQALGGFNPCMLTGEDVELSWRLQLQTRWRVGYAPLAAIYHRHRMTREGLARQYRQYGYGEILLDTIFRDRPNYPRSRSFQIRRMMIQGLKLFTYLLSMAVRRVRYLRGRASPYDLAFPGLRLLVERNSLRGKLDAMWDTRLMTDPRPAFRRERQANIQRFY